MSSPAIIASIFQELQAFNQSRRADIQQLASALQNSNLDAAKQAFNDLAAIGKNGPFANAEPFSNSNRAQAFEAIGQALEAGDLAGAQTALAALRQTFTARNNGREQQTSPAVIVTVGQNNGASAASPAESIYQQLQDFRNARQTGLAQLGGALRSGNPQAAQQAYNALVALGQSGPNRNGTTFQRSDRAQAFAAIGQALQSGDLAAAQYAFATLQATFERPLSPPTEPPVPAPAPGPATEIIINLGGASADQGGSPEVVVNVGSGNDSGPLAPQEVQINLGGNNGGKLTIDVTQAQNGGEHITIDFLQQNNEYRIALDLLNPTANATAQASSLSLHA